MNNCFVDDRDIILQIGDQIEIDKVSLPNL
jgi:hypothetical protein